MYRERCIGRLTCDGADEDGCPDVAEIEDEQCWIVEIRKVAAALGWAYMYSAERGRHLDLCPNCALRYPR